MGVDKRRRGLAVSGNGRGAAHLPDPARGETVALAAPWVTAAFVGLIVVAIAMAVDGGDRPFPYELGQRVDRDLRLRESLQLFNETKTRQKREESGAQAMAAFRLDAAAAATLKADAGELLRGVAATADYAQLDKTLRARWQLTPESFLALRTLATNSLGAAAAARTLDDAFAASVERGLFDPAALPEETLRETTSIEVVPPDGNPYYVRIEDAQLPQYVDPKGPFAKRLESAFHFGTPPAGQALHAALAPRLRATLTLDSERSKANRDARIRQVDDAIDTVKQGLLIVAQGDTIDEDKLRLLRAEHKLMKARNGWREKPERLLGFLALAAAVLAAGWRTLHVVAPELAGNPRKMLGLLFAALVAVVAARLLRAAPYHADILPVAVAALVAAVALGRLAAVVLAVALSVLVGWMDAQPLETAAIAAAGALAGALDLNAVRSRTKLMRVGAVVAGAYLLATLAVGALSDQPWSFVLREAAWNAGLGVVAGFLMSGVLPFVEQAFGVVTAISLKEVGDSTHPLLRELARRAPGTFNHSVMVSTLGEAAAKAIGANAELVRVGALFHDVGKTHKPEYFVENRGPDDRNRHDLLAPAMSTLVIIGHVKDGAEMARDHHLPQPLVDLIEQHHGTTRVDYFFRAAERRKDGDETVSEYSFRYPGPKPQSKEAAVLMLTDCVESASRALAEPTPGQLSKLVRELALARLLDGQFDECGLTLRELRAIEDALANALASVYHSRVKYPAAV